MRKSWAFIQVVIIFQTRYVGKVHKIYIMRDKRAFNQVLLILQTIYVGKAILQTIYVGKVPKI